MALNVSVGLKPSAPTSLFSLSVCCLIPATRISKNSSRFELKIVRNFTRSISGCVGSCASSKTRRLNSSQLSSRLMKFFGSEKGSLGRGGVSRAWAFPLGSSAMILAIACCIDYLVQNLTLAKDRSRKSRAISARIAQCDGLSGCDVRLMPDVLGGGGVNRVLGGVGGVVSDAFGGTREGH